MGVEKAVLHCSCLVKYHSSILNEDMRLVIMLIVTSIASLLWSRTLVHVRAVG